MCSTDSGMAAESVRSRLELRDPKPGLLRIRRSSPVASCGPCSRLSRRDGRRFSYSVSENASKRASGIVARIHRTLFKIARMGPVVALLEEGDLSTGELRELRRLVDAKLKERKR